MHRTALAALITACLASTGSAQTRLPMAGGSAELAAGPGAPLTLRGPSGKVIVRTGESGLWRARLRNGTVIDAAQYAPSSGERRFTVVRAASGKGATLRFTGPDLDVTVTAGVAGSELDLRAAVTPRTDVLLAFELPARLRFEAQGVRRFIFPCDGNQSVGMEFNSRFFLPQPPERSSAWEPTIAGAEHCATLFGGPPVQRADQDVAAALRPTALTRQWLGDGLAQRIAAGRAVVNRPCAPGTSDVTLAESDNGPWLSGRRVGIGWAWRIGGAVGAAEAGLARDAVSRIAARLAAEAPAKRRKVGVVALRRAPANGGWSAVPAVEWLEALRGSADTVVIQDPAQLAETLRSGDCAVVINPYGEWCPTLPQADMKATVAAIVGFARAGGTWIETGGHPFFYAMAPVRHYRFAGRYPALFADFAHLDAQAGSASIYRVQPLPTKPWTTTELLTSGELACGSDAEGGYFDRGYAPFVKAGATWRSPITRIALGSSAESGLARYAVANGITRKLAAKMRPGTLARFRNAVLLYLSGGARDKAAALTALPRPTLVHFADYLHGGFDKQYPDHLPPNAAFGTLADLQQMTARAQKLGHLVMPYTNPTWWCDNPRGPTFVAAGEAPLVKDLAGRPVYEKYGLNDGWTICYWHPAVREANRKTVAQFTETVPVDLLFQDQCGARTWSFDTSEGSPAPDAYVQGLLSMVAEDAAKAPLSTESGWDRVAQYEAQLCGMTWNLVPTERAPEWRRLLRETIAPETWSIYPLAQRLAHDKASMIHHDLGQFVTNDETLTWTLGLGFGLSYAASAQAIASDGPARQWLLWLDALQKAVVSRYVGAPVGAFHHERPQGMSEASDDGVIRATYGDVKITANLGREATAGPDNLPGFGFRAEAPGVRAGSRFVTKLRPDGRSADAWLYAPAAAGVTVELPKPVSGAATVTFDGAKPAGAAANAGKLSVTMPVVAAEKPLAPPADAARVAPSAWPGAKPAVGVIDLGPGPEPTWTRIRPTDWVKALASSPVAAKHGLEVKVIATAEELLAALRAGRKSWFAIVNPYGEGFPATAADRWTETLDAVRRYVSQGGCWWETAGYTHYAALVRSGEGWSAGAIGPAGVARIGVEVGDGPVDAQPAPLRVTDAGRAMLGFDLTTALEEMAAPANRGLAGSGSAAHTTLVIGGGKDYIGGYRLGGWGWYWRVGGFWPEPAAVLPLVSKVLEHLYTTPPAPSPLPKNPRVRHAVVRW
jgi:hypothetical protein